MGRPRSEMTPENVEAILRTIRLGLHPERAALAHGISPSTMRAHRRRNPDFATAVKEAESGAERGFLGKIIGHTDKQWTAAAWILERRWPERWAKRDKVEVSTKGDAKQLLADLDAMRKKGRSAKGDADGSA